MRVKYMRGEKTFCYELVERHYKMMEGFNQKITIHVGNVK